MNEPSLAEAEQSLGYILLKKDDLDEAQKHFEKAAQLNPNDALNFYGEGLVAMNQAGNAGVPPGAANAFEKAAALNPDFAPSWYYLAMIYSQRDETLPKAMADAQRAASLAPGESRYQLQLAALLDRAGHPDEARKMAVSAKESATDRATADKAGELVARMSKPQPPVAPASAGNAPAKPPSDPGLRIERKTEPEAKPSTTTTAPSSPKTTPAPVPPLFAESSKVYSMLGTITDVNCSGAPQIQVTLKAQTITMKLHADNLEKVSIKSAGSAAAAKGTTCASLRGRTARISYLLVSGRSWDGEMQEVEFRSQP